MDSQNAANAAGAEDNVPAVPRVDSTNPPADNTVANEPEAAVVAARSTDHAAESAGVRAPVVGRESEVEALRAQVAALQTAMDALIARPAAMDRSSPSAPVESAPAVASSSTRPVSRPAARDPSLSPIAYEDTTVIRDFEDTSLAVTGEQRGSCSPPVFTGKDVKPGEASRWIRKLRRYFVECNITLESRKLNTAIRSLQEQANDWADSSRFTSYEEFESEFLVNWEAPDYVEQMTARRHSLKYEGDVSKLYEEYRALLAFFPKIRNNLDWKLDEFISKLQSCPDLYEYALVKRKSSTMLELVTRLKTKEASLRRAKSLTFQSRPATSSSSNWKSNTSKNADKPQSSAPSSDGASAKKTNRVPRRIFREREQRGECGLCASKSHKYKDCPQKPSKRSSDGASSSATPQSN